VRGIFGNAKILLGSDKNSSGVRPAQPLKKSILTRFRGQIFTLNGPFQPQNRVFKVDHPPGAADSTEKTESLVVVEPDSFLTALPAQYRIRA
jgi:hypothetical protein